MHIVSKSDSLNYLPRAQENCRTFFLSSASLHECVKKSSATKGAFAISSRALQRAHSRLRSTSRCHYLVMGLARIPLLQQSAQHGATSFHSSPDRSRCSAFWFHWPHS